MALNMKKSNNYFTPGQKIRLDPDLLLYRANHPPKRLFNCDLLVLEEVELDLSNVGCLVVEVVVAPINPKTNNPIKSKKYSLNVGFFGFDPIIELTK
jgi:hypothetical protein